MIKATNVSRRYGDFVAVEDASFAIGHGQIVGLLGHNGAGKTTIMKMITGYLEPSSGIIEVDGNNVENQAETVQSCIGYLPESLPVYPEMTVVDYLVYCAQMRGIDSSDIDQQVKNVIDKTQLHEKALNPIATLSRGYKQRVGVAQALIHNPKILILDEPTNGLDPQQTRAMRDLIRELAKTTTVILSTHIMQEVDALCDRVIILENGKVAVDESLANLRTSDNIQLVSNITPAELASHLENHKVDILEEEERNQYQIKLNSGDKAEDLCAHIAEILIQNGHKIYSLTPIQRDLELVFRNSHQEKELNDAA